MIFRAGTGEGGGGMTGAAGSLADLRFDNRFTRLLPGDPVRVNTRRQVRGACFSRVLPTPVAAPRLVSHSPETAALLGLSETACASEDFVRVFAGNQLLPGMDPYAACYGGHQFGNWAGQLGDGRAINLGEVVNRQGQRWVLQLKGAGPTPYSRSADGLAVLRSSLREFLCSEAMFHLGVPTTRALSLILTGEPVERDMFYDGHPREEPGAVVCRVAPSFTRFGNFQLFTARSEIDVLRRLADFTIATDFAELGAPSPETYVRWFAEICRTTVEMIIHWLRVGFVHGVMNTDNMSILGLTIDYGPYGWLEDYDPSWTPNTTDSAGRRYCFGRQAQIGLWNLAQLANALYPLVTAVEPLEEVLTATSRQFEEGWRAMMAAKLGLSAYEGEVDRILIEDLLRLLPEVETDMTLFFRHLARVDFRHDGATLSGREQRFAPLLEAYYRPDQLSGAYRARLDGWLDRYALRLGRDDLGDLERRQRMDAVNPKYVLRNYLAQMAIDKAEEGDFTLVHELLDLLRRPYDEQEERERFAARRPDWARQRPGCSMLSCSS